MEIDATKEDGVATVRLKGRLDQSTAPQLRRELDGLVLRGVKRVVLDLQQLDSISSAGFQVMVSAHRALSAQRGQLVAARPQQPVAEVMRLSGLDRLIKVTPDLPKTG